MDLHQASSVTTRTAILLAAFLMAGFEPQPNGGREYRDALSAMIRGSDRIIVTEHSWAYDLLEPNSMASLIPEEIVYGTRDLSPAQKAMFLNSIERLDPTTQDSFPGCVAEVHHTIRFFAHGSLVSRMDICFHCGQVDWDGTTATPPWSLYSALSFVVKQIGFEPERDWTELAKQHLQQAPKTTR